MQPSVEATVIQFQKSCEAFKKEISEDPQKAKAFLIRAGIVEEVEGEPNRVQLTPQYR